MKLIIYGLLSICLISCEVPQVTPGISSLFPNQEWTKFAYQKVRESQLTNVNPSDEKEFCPKGLSSEGWVQLLSAMARFESNFKPDTEYRESFKNSRGEYVISTGLLQLSQESARGYGCPANSQAWLKDPFNNIDCSVTILNRWVVKDGCISCKSGSLWRGGARYWSVLRYKKTEIKELLKPFCAS